MKHSILVAALAVLASAIFAGCNKMESPGNNGVFVDNVRNTRLKSAFVGGGVADPTKGSSYRCHIYSEYYEEGPEWDKVQHKVLITGFRYSGKEYQDNGDFIDYIWIHDVPSIGDLAIPMNQGKYEGGSDLVSSVSIDTYYRGAYAKDGSQTEDARFKIRVVLKDKRRIDIRYVGATPYDDYY